jgi:hypothetical protein
MNGKEIEILQKAEVKAILQANLSKNPADFALSFSSPHFPTALLATQLKYLQKSKEKLPTYFQAGCLIPPLSYEQCSSEVAAEAKRVAGQKILDLTCGLGVDSLYFAQNFEEVWAVEQEENLAKIAEINFELLGKKNVKIINAKAELFLESIENEYFDWIYLDPARRDEKGKKVFLPEDCSPNVKEILPLLLAKSSNILIKYSPMYDISAAEKDFFPYLKKIAVVSIENECKEVLLYLQKEKNEGNVKKEICLYKKGEWTFFEMNEKKFEKEKKIESIDYQYIYEPDVAFYKANCVEMLRQKYAEKQAILLTDTRGFLLSTDFIENFLGRSFQITAHFPFKPNQIQSFLKKNNIKSAHILQRNFPYNAQKLQLMFKLKEGGDFFLIFTEIAKPGGKEMVLFIAKRIS